MQRFIELLRSEVKRTSPTIVAARLGVSENSIRNYLAGRVVPGGDVVVRALETYPMLLDAFDIVPKRTTRRKAPVCTN